MSESQAVPQGIAVGEPNPSAPAGKKMAFSEFMKQGGSYKCTVNQNIGGTESKGTTYMSEGMVRGEFVTVAQGMSMTASLIVRDGYTHSWTSMMPTMGFKSKVVTSAPSDTEADTSGTYSFDGNQIGDYDCQPWTPDASMFALPSGTTFTEMAK
jgi:hypothetical protein